jgi:putative transposase
MARKLRVQFAGAIYHVTARGVERRPIFNDDRDRAHFLDRLADGVESCGVRLYLFCLMGNHFHLLVETPRGNLSAFMHKVQTAHTVFYNLRHGHAGHLMQGRFLAIPVQGDVYLNRLSRYIHLNPVHTSAETRKPIDNRVRTLRGYRWSSYRGYAGLGAGWGFVDEGPVLAMAGGNTDGDRREAYRTFVEEGIGMPDLAFAQTLRGACWGIGDDGFQQMVHERHAVLLAAARRPEDVAFRRVTFAVDPQEVERVVAVGFGVDTTALHRRAYGCHTRAVAAYMLIKYAGLTQRDVAERLGVGSGAAVCQRLATLRANLPSDQKLAARVAAIDAQLMSCASAQATCLTLKG